MSEATPSNLDQESTPKDFESHQAKDEAPQLSVEAGKEDPKEEEKPSNEVSYESLVLTLKEKNKEIKKQENFRKKIEERYKEQVKEKKQVLKEKQVLEEFVKSIVPQKQLQTAVDAEGKYTEVELLKKAGACVKSKQPCDENSQTEMLLVLKEENEHLKSKLMEVSVDSQSQPSQNAQSQQKVKDLEKKISGLQKLIKEKDSELERFKGIETEFNEFKGKHLLQAFKMGKGEAHPTQTADQEELQSLKQLLSDKTNKILSLTDQLHQANETIQALESHKPSSKSQPSMSEEGKMESQDQAHDNLLQNLEEQSPETEELLQLRQRVEELEKLRLELLEKIEGNKEKARKLLMSKDLSVQRLKMVLVKLESYLKQQCQLKQEDINRIVALREEEVQSIMHQEKELVNYESCETFRYQTSEQNRYEPELLSHIDKQLHKNKAQTHSTPESGMTNIEYLRNVFVKYLEYLAGNNTREIRTIENLLFTELRVTKDQALSIDILRRQNTFWKKLLLVAQQPVVKNKFSAGVFKKKLFGGANNQGPPNNGANGMASARSSVSGFPQDLLNRTITSPFGGINTATEPQGQEDNQISNSLIVGNEHPGQRLVSDSDIRTHQDQQLKTKKAQQSPTKKQNL